jgi:hypothetical protein
MLPCAYKSLLGIDCPLCGGQRSLLLLLKGDMAGSFRMYPPLVPVLLCAALFIVYLVNRKLISAALIRGISLVVLIMVIISYIVRLAAGI